MSWQIRLLRRSVLAAALLLLGGCRMGTSDPASPAHSISTVQPTESPSASNGGSGEKAACANTLLPVEEGNRWTYSLSSNLPAPEKYSDEIGGVSSDGFEVTSGGRTQLWSCTVDGLVARRFGDGPTGALQLAGLGLGYETTGVEGVTLPADVAEGDVWKQRYTISAGADGGPPGTVSLRSEATGSESVPVLGRLYSAVRIESTIDIEAPAGSKVKEGSFTMFQWYREGGGLFETLVFGRSGGAKVSSTALLLTMKVGETKLP